jgi:uncharacterized protein YdeI (BOF family)
MKKFIPMLVLMLAFCMSVSAQMNPSSRQSTPTAGQAPATAGQTETSAGQTNPSDSSMKKDKMTSITGCVSESNGKYMIMDKSHPSGVQLESSDDLKPHVGHKVKVSGTMDGGSAQATGAQSGDMSSMVLKVSNMKMISEHCDASK